jgi:hypothetical protein
VDLWGAAAFGAAFALAVYDAKFTCTVMSRFGVVSETNPVVSWFATILGRSGVYLATILPTVLLLTVLTLVQSHLGLGVVLGARLCLFQFQRQSLRLQAQIEALISANTAGPPSSSGEDAP